MFTQVVLNVYSFVRMFIIYGVAYTTSLLYLVCVYCQHADQISSEYEAARGRIIDGKTHSDEEKYPDLFTMQSSISARYIPEMYSNIVDNHRHIENSHKSEEESYRSEDKSLFLVPGTTNSHIPDIFRKELREYAPIDENSLKLFPAEEAVNKLEEVVGWNDKTSDFNSASIILKYKHIHTYTYI